MDILPQILMPQYQCWKVKETIPSSSPLTMHTDTDALFSYCNLSHVHFFEPNI